MRWWRKRDAELERELQSDLELEEEEQRENGLSAEEARYAARRAFGNETLIREQTHEAWGWTRLERLMRDLRYAIRLLMRAPGFTITCVLILAIGIGATTAIFSLVNTVLLRPLPFPESDRLVWVSQQDHLLPGVVPESLSYPDYFDWRAQNHTLEGLASYAGATVTMELKGESERLDIQTVSSNFFRVLGAAPMLGRDLSWEDEKPGNRAVMLSYSFWQSQFGAEPEIVGKSITINGHSFTVAGVMPKGFAFPIENPAPVFWKSIADEAEGKSPASQQRGFNTLGVIARLRTGVTVEQAKADLSVIAGNLARQYPDNNKQYSSALVEPELAHMTGDTRPALRVLFGAVSLVLLLVCANVAGLLLACGSRRSAEFALRAAIGASRAAIIRQLLLESLLLSLCGGIAGIALAFGLMRTILTLMPVEIPRIESASIDGRVLVFVLIVSVATGLLFGAFPAWRLSRSAPARALREGGRSLAGGKTQHRLHNGLVVVQTAIGMVLLIGAGLLMRSFVSILDVNPGFDPKHVLTSRVGVPFDETKHDQHYIFYQQLIERISALPGVQAVSAGWPLPMSRFNATVSFNIQGRPVAKGDQPSESLGLAMPGYFETMKIPLIAGRDFGEQDGLTGQPTIIVNQAFARKYFPHENPIGQHIQAGVGDDLFEHPMREVVAVIGDIKRKGLTEEADPQFYLPYAQALITNPFVVVRTNGGPAMQAAIGAAIHELDKSVPVYQAATMEEYVYKSAAQPRFQTFLLSCFAVIALALTAIGLYGLLSYVVVQRTPEIGLRMALGAQRGDALRMIVLRGLTLALAGVVLGTAASAVLTRLISEMLFGVRPTDPVTLAATVVLLLAVSVAASCVPAIRASRLDPMKTLREQ
jgi:predicted permease